MLKEHPVCLYYSWPVYILNTVNTDFELKMFSLQHPPFYSKHIPCLSSLLEENFKISLLLSLQFGIGLGRCSWIMCLNPSQAWGCAPAHATCAAGLQRWSASFPWSCKSYFEKGWHEEDGFPPRKKKKSNSGHSASSTLRKNGRRSK